METSDIFWNLLVLGRFLSVMASITLALACFLAWRKTGNRIWLIFCAAFAVTLAASLGLVIYRMTVATSPDMQERFVQIRVIVAEASSLATNALLFIGGIAGLRLIMKRNSRT